MRHIGRGGEKNSAHVFMHRMSVIFLSSSDGVHGGLGGVRKDDIVILLTKGGETMELMSMIPAIKHKKAFLVGVSENENSVLAKQSDIFLKVKISKEADIYNLLATSGITAALTVFDAIAVVIMTEKKYTRNDFAAIHPGGAVGVKLTGKTLYIK